MRKRFTAVGVLGAVFALVLGVMPVFGAVSAVGTVSDPGNTPGRSPALPFAGSAVPTIVPAPDTVVEEENWDNGFIKVFDEQQGVILAGPLDYDQLSNLTDEGTIPAGTVVDSHYVHFDNEGFSSSNGSRGVGTITFECPIIGLITQDTNLAASDGKLGAAITSYPTTLTNRGLEQGEGDVGDHFGTNWHLQDITDVSTDMLTLFVDLQVFNVLDQMRVVTEGCPIDVDIDIKPGSFPNSLNSNGHGVIPVAILGSADFDVAQIDVITLVFAGLEVRVKGNGSVQCSIEDVNGDYTAGLEGVLDGYLDLVCQFVDDTTSWDPGVGTATITGELLDGTPFEGSDTINFIG
jgi:hypothetical protein